MGCCSIPVVMLFYKYLQVPLMLLQEAIFNFLSEDSVEVYSYSAITLFNNQFEGLSVAIWTVSFK